jgi:hypothetical protein
MGGSARRNASTFTQNNTITEQTHRSIHDFSGPTISVFERTKAVNASDRLLQNTAFNSEKGSSTLFLCL